MTNRAIETHYPAYRAPTENATSLITPAPEPLLASLRECEPEHVGAPETKTFCGLSLASARAQARCESVRLAVRFTSRYRNVGDLGFCRQPNRPDANGHQDETADERAFLRDCQELVPGSTEAATPAVSGRFTKPIILTGHQPELFHSGVWFKNFLASRLAADIDGIAINFLVDNDVCRSASIRVPSRVDTGIVSQSIPFDEQRDAVPWELRQLSSRATWDAFPKLVKEHLLPMAGQPLIDELWTLATTGLEDTNRLGLAISQGRHQLERSLGLKTLEVPLSWLAETQAFGRFCLTLISDLTQFQRVYNVQLERYRQAHQIRNHAHPVPPLEQEHEWLEAPLWVYRKSSPHRQRLWVSLRRGELRLTDRAGWQATIDVKASADNAPCENSLRQWMDLQSDGVCLRPRALLTTMYTRLFVSDLFVHGIGGGKYDQLTDAIIADYFQLPPPPMVVASATLRLPWDTALLQPGTSAETSVEIRRNRDQMRRARNQGDTVLDTALDDGDELQELQRRKSHLLANIPPRGQKWDWHHQITAVNKRLSELAEPKFQEAKAAVDQLTALERQQRLLESREVSFALFPRDYISEALTKLASP